MKPKIFLIFILAILLIAALIVIKRNSNSVTGDTNFSKPPAASGEIPAGSGSANSKYGDSGKVAVTPAFIDKAASDFVAGSRKWKLIYSDQSLPELTRQRINYDLNLIYGNMSRFVIDAVNPTINLPDGRVLDRRVRFEGGTLFRPAALEDTNGLGCLFRGGSESEVFVPQAVSDAYVKAFELEKQHEAAFAELDRFLQRMTEIKTHPISSPRDLFVIANDNKEAEATMAAIPAAGFADAWGGKLYRSSSVLDVRVTTGTRGEDFIKYGDLWAITYMVSGDKLDQLPPLVFKDGKWRFLIL